MESTAIQAIFDRDGYITLPVFVTPHKLGEIRRELDRFLAAGAPHMPPEFISPPDRRDPAALRLIQQLHRFDPYFKELLHDDHFQLVAETVLKEKVVGVDARYFDKVPGANEPTPPHQDGALFYIVPCHAVELWLALDDAEEDTGCIWYARGSHVMGLLPHEDSGNPAFSKVLADRSPCEDPRTRVPCRTRAGDLLAHHALTVHWAGPNESNHRHCRALSLVYYGESVLSLAEDTPAAHGAT